MWLVTFTALLLLGVLGIVIVANRSSRPSLHIATTTITISNFMFHPMSVTVAPGTTIKVINDDTTVHTLSSVTGVFDTGNIAAHGSKEFFAPLRRGSYQYMCNIHQFMMGSIIVK